MEGVKPLLLSLLYKGSIGVEELEEPLIALGLV